MFLLSFACTSLWVSGELTTRVRLFHLGFEVLGKFTGYAAIIIGL